VLVEVGMKKKEEERDPWEESKGKGDMHSVALEHGCT